MVTGQRAAVTLSTLAACLVVSLLAPAPAGAATGKLYKPLTDFLGFGASVVSSLVLGQGIEHLSGTDVGTRLEAAEQELRVAIKSSSAEDRVWAQEQLEIVHHERELLRTLIEGRPTPEQLEKAQSEITALAGRLRKGLADHERRFGGAERELERHDERLKRLEERFLLNPRSRIVKIRVKPFEVRSARIPRELAATAAEYLAAMLANDERVQLVEEGPADVEVTGALESVDVNRHRVDDFGIHTLTIRHVVDATITASRPTPRQIYTKKPYSGQATEFFPTGQESSSSGSTKLLDALDSLATDAAADLLAFLFWDPLADEAAVDAGE